MGREDLPSLNLPTCREQMAVRSVRAPPGAARRRWPQAPESPSALWLCAALALLDVSVGFLVTPPAGAGGAAQAVGARTCVPRSALAGHLQLRAAAVTTVAAGRPATKPRGYWHDWANVEAELRQFIAANGSKGQMPSTSTMRKAGMSSLADAISRFGGVQTVAGRLGLECGKPKGYWQEYANVRREYEDFLAIWRVTSGEATGVPTQEMLRQAGRQDLISALQKHGGMQRLAEDLDLPFYTTRRTGAGSVSGVASGRHKVFQGRLWSFIAVNGTNGYMPTSQVLNNFGCHKLAEDVERLGGAVKLAKRFGLKVQRMPMGLDLIQDALMDYVAASGKPGIMPTTEELLSAGRGDLEARLERVGRERACRYTGLYMDEHARLQAECDTDEALRSKSFVELAVKAQRPSAAKKAEAETFVRRAPLFRGDTSMAGAAPRQTPRQQGARPDSGRSMERAVRAVSASVRLAVEEGGGAPEARTLDEMKARFRRRLVAKSMGALPRQELDSLSV
jgi:hypothetical protein